MWHGSDIAIVLVAGFGSASLFAMVAGRVWRSLIDARRRAAIAVLRERYLLDEADLDAYRQALAELG